MKQVLLSIKPKYCELIASGKKTIEIRKTRPVCQTPFKVSDATAAAANTELPDVELPDETPECVPALGDLDVKAAAVIETGAAFIKSFLEFAVALFQRVAQALTATAGECSELAKQLQILANGGVTTEALQRAKMEHPRVRHLAEHGRKQRTRKKNRNRLIKYAKQIERRGTKKS